MRDRHRKTPTRVLALLVGVGLVAAACGSSSKSSNTTAPSTQNTVASTTQAPLKPVAGGKLVIALEAETDSGWTPAKMVCAISCHMVAKSVYDTLLLVDADGNPAPDLLTKFDHSADYKTWTLTVRDGVQFHDGTKLDAAAVVDNLQRHQKAFLTGKAVKDLQKVEVDPTNPMVVIATMSRPWVSFPQFLTGQVGYIASPTWLKAADADPTLETKPVGTGPFVFKEYKKGDHFTATKNANYWRKAEGLPYLDEIEFRPLDDSPQRRKGLETGTFDMIHTTSGKDIIELRKEATKFPMVETTKYGETGYYLINVGNEGANANSPLLDQRVRCGLAYGHDPAVLVNDKYGAVDKIANGPFSPDQLGYLADTGYPKPDVAKGKALIDAYKAEKGVTEVKVKLTTTPSADAQEDNTIVAQEWKAIGVTAELANVEQGSYIVKALQGDFQIFAWRNHGGPDPDTQRFWWHSEAADKIGGFALNFGRMKDPVIDKNLDIIRENPDPAARKTAAQDINKQFGAQCYDLFESWTTWAIAFSAKVHGVQDFKLPDSGKPAAFGSGIAGTWQLASIWKEA